MNKEENVKQEASSGGFGGGFGGFGTAEVGVEHFDYFQHFMVLLISVPFLVLEVYFYSIMDDTAKSEMVP